ncbi:MAG: riboflavin synthase [Actinobacteria bacterium]|uniref:Riboflavin synthase n=1 Tax=freshwater metagenome TaxID=449393 RepID=A0A6J6TC87_9ZZZZ|nr:riboflavin synthase [Actinomycetota bacterium]
MFTGIVEERGTVASIEQLTNAARVAIRGSVVLSDVRAGDSIAVNGVCLTVVDLGPDYFTADVMEETLKRSSLDAVAAGSEVNLERAARLDSRLGGHLVQGHVDGTGAVLAIEPDAHWTAMRISLPVDLGRYVVEKGSITVDGVSLTVVAVDDEAFSVSLIPTTLAETTLGWRQVGDRVNLEVDAIAKYVERLMQGRLS